MADQGKKYVVVHEAVGGWSRGDVVEADRLVIRDRAGKEPDYDAAPKLLARGAIREASAAEANRPRVAVEAGPGPAFAPRVQAGLEELEAERVRKERRLGDLRDRLASYERLGLPGGSAAAAAAEKQAEEDPTVQKLFEEKVAALNLLDEETREVEEQVRKAEEEARAQAGKEVKPFAPIEKRREQQGREGEGGGSPPPPTDQGQQPAARGKPERAAPAALEPPQKVTTVQDARREAEEKQRHKKE